ncbi:RnfH family protein [Psychrobacter sp. I-STPA6b]|uniref:RnfH family protein n=1 Tax=Psychrobacter sp. I-STPA6b TaxID=2585718 RepID=UPI001D0C0512|nr:RnfH family protein [Psychrobacter sp. I-STPA6b]
MGSAMIAISMAYAPSASEQWYHEMQVPQGTTVYSALQMAGWLDKDEALSVWCQQNYGQPIIHKDWRVGVCSQKQPLDYQLDADDRLEVYRPLSVDPMRKRKKRATSV